MDPDPYWPPSGSGSVKNEYGSETLIQITIFSDGDIKVELPCLSPGAEAEFSAFEDEPKVEDEDKQKYEELTDTLPDRYIMVFI